MATSSKTAAQQQILDEMRAAKKNPKRVVSATVLDEPAHEQSAESYINELMERLPSGKRAIAATVVPIILAFGAGMVIGHIVVAVITAFSFGLFMSFITWLLGMILSFYVGLKIGQHVGGYILSGQIDKDVISVKDKVVGWFKPKQVAAA